MARRFLTTLRSNAIALVAVLIAMSGTATAAGFVVSRNAQVGPWDDQWLCTAAWVITRT